MIAGSTTALVAALAGCGGTFGSSGSGADPTEDSTSTPTEGSAGDSTPGKSSPTASETVTVEPTASSYEACIEPAGCLTFEAIPETYIVNNGEWADMAFALVQRDDLLTTTNMTPGFLFEPFGLDVPPSEEISEEVAPFLGNNILRRREFHDNRLYRLYGALERLAELFQERERYEALKEVQDEGAGVETKTYRDLDVGSAFSEAVVEKGIIDNERLLAVDPEIIVVQ